MRKPRTKAAMIEYLSEHFRYNTMNSWNRSTSYAVNIKVHKLGLPRDLENRAFDMLEVRESFRGFNAVLRDFDKRHNYSYQIGSNGRSGGYLVLYQGGQRPSQHKSYCTECGQRNFTRIEENSNVCGRCYEPTRVNCEFSPEHFTYPGKSLDMDEEFAEWDMYDLRNRVDLVWDFDRTCQKAVNAFIDFCKTHIVKDDVVMVPTDVRIAVPV